jgi:ABC-type sugar transport system ATPase subunit
VQQADVYMFDEPSSYLDVKQRLQVCTPFIQIHTRFKYVTIAIMTYTYHYLGSIEYSICLFRRRRIEKICASGGT